MILKLLLVSIAQGIITKSYGDVSEFKYTTSGFNCQYGYTRSKTITFSDSFANVPKIIFVPKTLSVPSFSSSYLTVKLEILSVSLTSYRLFYVDFQIKILCPSNPMLTYEFSWFAIDDSRLEVINEAISDINLNPVGQKQYPIQNPNIKKAVSIIQSFGYDGGFDITLSISELTSTHVTVNINNANSHLVFLGYQVILGTDEVISFIDEITSTSDYTSQLYPIISDSYFVTSITHLKSTGTSALKFIQSISTSTTISYHCQTCCGVPYPPNTLKVFWLITTLNSEFLAMQCFTIRVSKLYDRYVDLKPAFQLEILEINKVINTIGSESIILNESIQLVTIHIFYKCPSNNKKVHSQLNRCNSCTGTNKIYNLNHYCHGSVNSINIYAKYQAQANYKELTLTGASNSVTIVQPQEIEVPPNKIYYKQNFQMFEIIKLKYQIIRTICFSNLNYFELNNKMLFFQINNLISSFIIKLFLVQQKCWLQVIMIQRWRQRLKVQRDRYNINNKLESLQLFNDLFFEKSKFQKSSDSQISSKSCKYYCPNLQQNELNYILGFFLIQIKK